MYQIRHFVQLLIVLICLLWGAYQLSAQASALSLPRLAGPAAVSATEEELAALYPNLPVSIAKAVPSVVATQQVLDKPTGKGIVASGVILNDHQVLTAGHNIEGDGRIMCGQVAVIASGALSRAVVSKDAVSHASVRYGTDTDLAALTVQASDNFRKLPDITIAKRLPQKGDPLYFINYQPAADGTLRSPAAQTSNDPAHDFSKPVIFAGTYLGETNEGMSIAVGYGPSYGQGAGDIMVRKGASGGAIVNVRGELVGLTVSSESLAANRSAASIVKDFGVRLPEQYYQVAHMQPVSKAVVGNLQKDTVACDKQ